MAQLYDAACVVEERIALSVLCLHGEFASIGSNGEIEVFGCAGRESCILSLGPLHRRACAGAFVAAFLVRQVFLEFHSYLVAVVDERYAWHGEEESHCHFELVGGVAQLDVGSLVVVVGRWDCDVAFGFCRVVGTAEIVDELLGGAFAARVEVAVVKVVSVAERRVLGEEKRAVTLYAEVHHEVYVEACRDCHFRVRPF